MRSHRGRGYGRRTVRRMDGILREFDAPGADHESETALSSKQSDHSGRAANASAVRIQLHALLYALSFDLATDGSGGHSRYSGRLVSRSRWRAASDDCFDQATLSRPRE